MSIRARHAHAPTRRVGRYILLLLAGVLVFAGVGVCLLLPRSSTPANLPVESPASLPAASSAVTHSPSDTTAAATTTSGPSIESTAPSRAFSFSAQTKAELDTLIAGYDGNVSVYFEDLASGYVYQYGASLKYQAASVLKAPYCMYIYDLASQGKADLDKIYTYTEKHYAGGTGILQNMPAGSVFSLRELLYDTIVYSDNIALRIMRDAFPAKDFQAYAASLGLRRPADIRTITGGFISTEDAGVYLRALYRFMEENPYGPELKELMMSTRNPMIRSSWPLARKYGWADKSFHDMGIVYAPHPYALAILSDHEEGNAEDFQMFRTISAAVERAATA